jgi:hypothetical protein
MTAGLSRVFFETALPTIRRHWLFAAVSSGGEKPSTASAAVLPACAPGTVAARLSNAPELKRTRSVHTAIRGVRRSDCLSCRHRLLGGPIQLHTAMPARSDKRARSTVRFTSSRHRALDRRLGAAAWIIPAGRRHCLQAVFFTRAKRFTPAPVFAVCGTHAALAHAALAPAHASCCHPAASPSTSPAPAGPKPPPPACAGCAASC